MSKDNDMLFNKLCKTRDNIYSLCELSSCPKLGKCMSKSSICLKNVNGSHRDMVEKSGGDFKDYIDTRNKLVVNNGGLVVEQAKNICVYTMKDILQEGFIGLIRAVELFDPSRGNKFSTYAHSHIRKMIFKYIKINDLVKKTGQGKDLMKSIHKAFDILIQDKHRNEITTDQLIDEIKKDRSARGLMKMQISKAIVANELDNLIIDQNFGGTLDVHVLAEPTEEQEHLDGLYELLSDKLDEDLIKVSITIAETVKMRFGLGYYDRPTNIKNIASVLNITRQGVEHRIMEFFNKKAWNKFL